MASFVYSCDLRHIHEAIEDRLTWLIFKVPLILLFHCVCSCNALFIKLWYEYHTLNWSLVSM